MHKQVSALGSQSRLKFISARHLSHAAIGGLALRLGQTKFDAIAKACSICTLSPRFFLCVILLLINLLLILEGVFFAPLIIRRFCNLTSTQSQKGGDMRGSTVGPTSIYSF